MISVWGLDMFEFGFVLGFFWVIFNFWFMYVFGLCLMLGFL